MGCKAGSGIRFQRMSCPQDPDSLPPQPHQPDDLHTDSGSSIAFVTERGACGFVLVANQEVTPKSSLTALSQAVFFVRRTDGGTQNVRDDA